MFPNSIIVRGTVAHFAIGYQSSIRKGGLQNDYATILNFDLQMRKVYIKLLGYHNIVENHQSTFSEINLDCHYCGYNFLSIYARNFEIENN